MWKGSTFPVTLTAPTWKWAQPQLVEGTQWVSGKYQQVKGGRGALAAANGGLEPTGRHPFGNAFKVAVLDTDEATGTAETGLYFPHVRPQPVCGLGLYPLLHRSHSLATGAMRKAWSSWVKSRKGFPPPISAEAAAERD
jgi:hypothetical protein